MHTCTVTLLQSTQITAIKAVLETPISVKHACWWSKVYASGVRSVQIVYCPGKENSNADALSGNPQAELLSTSLHYDVQVAMVDNNTSLLVDSEISQFLQQEGYRSQKVADTDLGTAQQEDLELQETIQFLCNDILPDDHIKAKKIAAQAQSFAIIDGVLYFIDQKNNHCCRCVVPKQLRSQLIENSHSGSMAGHFFW